MTSFAFPPMLSEPNDTLHTLKTASTSYVDHSKESDIIQSINKAQEEGINCIDLSKRHVKEFPTKLLEFTSLQYLYLEGNLLIQLPEDLFIRLVNLKWLDLRNNKLTSIPSHGLGKHRSLQYLLLSGNHLRELPCELGKVKHLTALNLDRNPLDYPPFDIIKQGIKAIQQYLRSKLSSDDELSSTSSDDDVDDNDNLLMARKTPQPQIALIHRKSNSEQSYYETSPPNLLPPHLQSCLQLRRVNYSPTRPSTSTKMRPQSELRMSSMKTNTLIGTSVHNNSNASISTIGHTHNSSLPDAYSIPERPLTQQRFRVKKIHEELQPTFQRTFITNKEYEEPLVHTPFHIDPQYIRLMNKSQSEIVRAESRQKHLPKYSLHDDEEKRARDRQIQERIRQITDRMLKRRFEARRSMFDEKRQIKLDLRELRKLETAANENRPYQINNRFKAFYDKVQSEKKS